MSDVPVGSDAELRSMMYGVDAALEPDPRVDRALRLMIAPEAERVVTLVTTKSDEERAAEYKAQMRAAADKVCEIVTAAKRDGILISWQMSWDAAGRAFVSSVDSMKPL